MRRLRCSFVLALVFLGGAGRQDRLPPLADGRLGTVEDVQGLVFARPDGAERWRLLQSRRPIYPGVWLRAPARGANAARLRLAGRGTVTLGPGAQLELLAGRIRLERGEAALAVLDGKALVLEGPGGARVEVRGRVVYAADGRRLVRRERRPRWLEGFESSTTAEWLGSLLAKVDGRDVPLAVGYHKVSVTIRERVAETVIEESFVNSTDKVLEGVFRFPLPDDASIAGFGMWVGGELIEADVVERAKARRIYEDLMRRKKDPGLLEWSGGNLFKARVYPIAPHGEKRIRLRYTQVLPLEGKTLRYRYALRSELLRAHPLRELRIDVTLSSRARVERAFSPTHACRIRRSEHAAQVSFAAESFTPERDFEAAFELEEGPPISVVAHRRGPDGYFMLRVKPTAEALGHGLPPARQAPLDLILVADTSASIDARARRAQHDFVQALLGLLGPRDRFRLAACDLDLVWAVREPSPPDEEHTGRALAFLEARPSLGWTAIDKVFRKVFAAAGPGTVVVYLGDGLPTAGGSDAAAAAAAIEAAAAGKQLACHAVRLGNTAEPIVLEALARAGHGSVWRADRDPAGTAAELLAELLRPSLEDVEVALRGVQTADVHPRRLGRVPLGGERIVLGLYLPAERPLPVEAELTGRLGGEEVRMSARLSLAPDPEASFLPRLWAERAIDALLAAGASAPARERIIALSKKYGIATPLTSFLVLESEEDRRRYGVERTVHMRDGEAFFARGRADAQAALRKDLLARHKAWRLELERRMRAEIEGLGLDRVPPVLAIGVDTRPRPAEKGGYYGAAAGSQDVVFRGFEESRRSLGRLKSLPAEAGKPLAFDKGPAADEELVEEEAEEIEAPMTPAPAEPVLEVAKKRVRGRPASPRRQRAELRSGLLEEKDVEGFVAEDRLVTEAQLAAPGGGRLFRIFGFPALPPGRTPPPPAPPVAWPEEVRKLVRALDRRPRLAREERAFEIEVADEDLHPLRAYVRQRRLQRGFWSAQGWSVTLRHAGGRARVDFLRGAERGALFPGIRLAAVRAAGPADRAELPFSFGDFSNGVLERLYGAWSARLERGGDGTRIEFEAPGGGRRVVLELDEERRVVTGYERIEQGEVVRRAEFRDFVTGPGGLVPSLAIVRDGEGRIVHRRRIGLQRLDAKALAAARSDLDRALAAALVLHRPLPSHEEAAAKPGFASSFRLLLDAAGRQLWDEAFAAFEAARKAAGDAPGLDWLELELLAAGRRAGRLPAAALLRAGALARLPRADRAGLARELWRLAAPLFGPAERARLLAALAPAKLGVEARDYALWHLRTEASELHGRGLLEEALERRRRLHRRAPLRFQFLAELLDALVESGFFDESLERIERALRGGVPWSEAEVDGLQRRRTDILYRLRRLDALGRALEDWTAAGTHSEEAWLRWLSFLVLRGRGAEADAWAEKLLAAKTVPAEREARARLFAAVRFTLGEGWNFQSVQVGAGRLEALFALARALVESRAEDHGLLARIAFHRRFAASEARARLNAAALTELTAHRAAAEAPRAILARLLPLPDWRRVPQDAFERVLGALDARRRHATDPVTRRFLGDWSLRLLDARGLREKALELVRSVLEDSDPAGKPAAIAGLMRRLVDLPWRAERRGELLDLLLFLGKVLPADRRAQAWPQAVRWTADQLERLGWRRLLGDPAALEKLPRKERRRRERAARRRIRAELARAFAAAAERAGAELAPWLEVESLTFELRSGAPLEPIVERSFGLLDRLPELKGARRGERTAAETYEIYLRERAALIPAYASLLRRAGTGLAERVLASHRARAEKARDSLVDWRYQLFRLLVAHGREKEIAEHLAAWSRDPNEDGRWARYAAWLALGRDAFAEALESFERARRKGAELEPRDWEVVADCRLLLGRKEAAEEARVRALRATPIWNLRSFLWREFSRVGGSGGGVTRPSERAVRALRVLFEKSSNPAGEIWYLRTLYERTKDHRLLACLPAGILGHTLEGGYGFLRSCWGLLAAVHEEAALDRVFAAVTEVRPRARNDGERRMLLFLDLCAAARAARVELHPEIHLRRALDALRAAWRLPWSAAEAPHAAAFLAALGKLELPELAAEQRRRLAELAGMAEPGGKDWLEIAFHNFRTVSAYGERTKAADGLSAALATVRDRHGGRLPAFGLRRLENAVRWYAAAGRYRRAETLLQEEIAARALPVEKRRLEERLIHLRIEALAKGGAVGLGTGEGLFEALRLDLLQRFAKEPDRLGRLVPLFSELHRRAYKEAKLRRAKRVLVEFAMERFPALRARALTEGPSLTSSLRAALEAVAGPRVALRFLVETILGEPAWYRRAGLEGWRRHGWELAHTRAKAGRLELDLEERLFQLVASELERDLDALSWRSRYLVDKRYSYFWNARRASFAAVAKKVLARRADEAHRLFVCRYLADGLGRLQDALEPLAAAWQAGTLSSAGAELYAGYLEKAGRFAEMLPVLERLLGERPGDFELRLRRIRALAGAGRSDEGRRAAQALRAELKAKERWDGRSAARWAEVCRRARFDELAALGYEEAIRLREKRVRLPDGTLATWYGRRAAVLSRLGRHDEAVEAASAAVVAWGRNQDRRRAALAALRRTLVSIPDLESWIARYEARVAKTGLDAPILRKSLGRVLLERGEADAARRQLLAARELEPGDREVHAALLQALDRLGRREEAVAAVLAWLRRFPGEWSLYAQLARRLAALARPQEAERALTSGVELRPTEAAAHADLARRFEQSGRLAEAAIQWRRAAALKEEDPKPLLALGRVLARLGRNDEAVAVLQRILDGKWDQAHRGVVTQAAALLHGLRAGRGGGRR